MSYEATDAVLKHSQAKGTERLVLLVIATHANPESGEAWPSIATLAAEAAIGERQVQALVRRLQVSGELTIEEGRGRKNTNTYRVTCLKKVQDSTPFSAAEKVQDSTEKVQDRVKKVQDSTEKVLDSTPKPKEPNRAKEEPKTNKAQESAAPVEAAPSQESVQKTKAPRAARQFKAPTADKVPASPAQQAMFAALALACYGGHDSLTDAARGRVANAARSLIRANFTATEVPLITHWMQTTEGETWRSISVSNIEDRAPVWRSAQRGSLPVRVAKPSTIKFRPPAKTTEEANDRVRNRAQELYNASKETRRAVF